MEWRKERSDAVSKGEWRGSAPFTGIAGFLGAVLPFAVEIVIIVIATAAQPQQPRGMGFLSTSVVLGIGGGIAVGLFSLGLLLAAPLGGIVGGWLRHGGDVQARTDAVARES